MVRLARPASAGLRQVRRPADTTRQPARRCANPARPGGGADEPDTAPIESGPIESGPIESGPIDSAPVESDPLESGGSTAAKPRSRSTWRELPILIVVALAIALVIKTFVVQPFFIPSSSMENTLMIGDKVLVNKIIYHFRSIQPGDIIVFNGVGSWNAAPPPAKPAFRSVRARLRCDPSAAVSLGRRAVRHSGRANRLHKAGHRRPR